MASDPTDGGLWCVVPAAGLGSRFGGAIPKQYLPLGGAPLLLHTLERLVCAPAIAGLMVVLAADDHRWPGVRTLAGKPVLTTVGGAERADSVLSGLCALSDIVNEDQFVLVHDAARPCVRVEDIERLIDRAGNVDGGLLACRLRDTLKRSDAEGRVVATESRDALWRALTPQMFRRGALSRALLAARAAAVKVTDEAMAMERVGIRPLLVEASEDNIKVTTPADLALAEFLLARR
jgi:2-C-methyl-D-erythritol 4-phosphate cytidylyltransferase